MTNNLNSWMTDMYDQLKSKPINNIIMPGTHDSGTYQFDINGSTIWNNSIVNNVKLVRNWPCVKSMIINWSKCHNGTIYDQLCNGIRTFDFRVSYDSTNNIFYITHTFTCVKMINILNDINKFMDLNKKEIIVICCKPDFDNRDTMYNSDFNIFLDFVTNNLNNNLYDSIGSFPTYEQMIEANKRIIFSYEDASSGTIWNESLFNLPWTNTSTVSQKIIGLENSLKSFQTGYFNVLDFMLTPQTNDIVKSAFLGGCCFPCLTLRGFAKKMNRQLANFISTNKSNFANLSGFIFDFPDIDVIQAVINLNK
jgi:hypothetical protein